MDTGGSNVQFAINPQDGRMVIIEMNPRVSRSSALASKATGFPIAKIAAKLAVGYRLDEIPNDITRKTPACFEPTIDYVVAKIPKWAFEKFPGADPALGTQMKSVGEVMAIGRTFKEALWKGIRSLETGKAFGIGEIRQGAGGAEADHAHARPPQLHPLRHGERLQGQRDSRADLHRSVVSGADQRSGRSREPRLGQALWPAVSAGIFRRAKRYGISDVQLAKTWGADEIAVRAAPQSPGRERRLQPRGHLRRGVRKLHAVPLLQLRKLLRGRPGARRKKVMILGSGPNRIGQGIEFDYCCCHASFALQEMGVESIMVNCNPETVSTDYDTSDRLYFEPLTLEDVLNIVRHGKARRRDRAVRRADAAQPGAAAQGAWACPIIGTDPANIDLAEDRKLFGKLLDDLHIPCPENGTATNVEEACAVARAHRLPGAGAAQLRAGRPRHGDRLRRGDDPPVHARSRHVLAGPPGADRPLPGRRHGSGCGRARRCGRRRADRRHHGAHRGGRRAFRR